MTAYTIGGILLIGCFVAAAKIDSDADAMEPTRPSIVETAPYVKAKGRGRTTTSPPHQCDEDIDCGQNATCARHHPLIPFRICMCKRSFKLDDQRNCMPDPEWCNRRSDCQEEEICCEYAYCDASSVRHCFSKNESCPSGCGTPRELD